MIFAIADHIEQIKQGKKTQTRRTPPCADRYQVGKDYSIQPCRTCKGIPEGRILVTDKRKEILFGYVAGTNLPINCISEQDSLAEGEYSPEDFERLYATVHPNWRTRYAYKFIFVKNTRREVIETARGVY